MNALFQILVPASLLFAAPTDAPERKRGDKPSKMERYDADGSGTLSAAEVAGTKLEARFSTIDADSDGELTRAEMKAARKGRKGRKGDCEGKGKRGGKGKRSGKGGPPSAG